MPSSGLGGNGGNRIRSELDDVSPSLEAARAATIHREAIVPAPVENGQVRLTALPLARTLLALVHFSTGASLSPTLPAQVSS